MPISSAAAAAAATKPSAAAALPSAAAAGVGPGYRQANYHERDHHHQSHPFISSSIFDLLQSSLKALALIEENRQAGILELKELSGLTMATIKVKCMTNRAQGATRMQHDDEIIDLLL